MSSQLYNYGIFNMTVPGKGAKVIPFVCNDLRTGNVQLIDLSLSQDLGEIDYIQGIYIDNWNNDQALEVVCGISNHRVCVPANSQMWTPLLCPNPAKVTITADGDGLFNLTVYLYNVPIPPFLVINPAP